jgi:hypothetical protein
LQRWKTNKLQLERREGRRKIKKREQIENKRLFEIG